MQIRRKSLGCRCSSCRSAIHSARCEPAHISGVAGGYEGRRRVLFEIALQSQDTQETYTIDASWQNTTSRLILSAAHARQPCPLRTDRGASALLIVLHGGTGTDPAGGRLVLVPHLGQWHAASRPSPFRKRTWPTRPGLIHWAFGFLIGIPFGAPVQASRRRAPRAVPACPLVAMRCIQNKGKVIALYRNRKKGKGASLTIRYRLPRSTVRSGANRG
jgi:hypothetical protein